ncbi:MAG: TRAP transporter small permease [Rhodospirillales bacterium]
MGRALATLGRLHDWLTDAGYVLGAAALFAMAASYFFEVFARYFFSAPTAWASVTVAHLLLVTVFLLLPHATRAVNHIAVDLVFQLLPAWSRPLRAAVNAVGFLVCSFATVMSFDENVRQYADFIYTEGNIQFPKWWASSFITFGFAMSALWFLRLAFDGRPANPRLRLIPRATP